MAMLLAWHAQAQCPQPTVTGNQILCSNSTLTLTAQGNYTSYAWSNGDNTASTVISTPSVYTVTVTCSNGSTAIGGASVQGFTTGIGIVNPVICAGQCAQANILVTNGQNSGPFTAVLSLSTGGTETVSSPGGQGSFFTVQLCPTQTTTYTILSVTNSQGCTAFINPNIASGTITVNGGSISIIGPTSLCTGQTATLSADPANFQSYAWSNGGTGSTTTVASPGTYSVTATAAGGCTANSSITVDPVPFDPPSITGGGTLCSGSSIELTVSGGYTSYAWSNGGTGPSINISASGTYTVTVTNANGCTGIDSEVVNAGTSANPSINGPSSICPNATASFTTVGNFVSYQWSSGETSSSITTSTPGIYTVTVTNSEGCTGTASQTLGSSPLPSVSFTANNPAVCVGDCLTFNVAFTGTPPFNLTYSAGSSGSQTQTFTASNGTIQICPPVGTPPGAVTLSAVSLTDANCVCE
ncbi:MAG: hypothetical protein IPN76_33285 [Saprospiraceae bacterium]|nr:hypothetical protein [Saprospiraceae bacterium]